MDTFWIGAENQFPRTREPVLVREWIRDALYTRTDAYFEKPQNMLQTDIISFNELRDQEEYDARVQEAYGKGAAWHTPSELFKPYYGESLLKGLDPKGSIYELGPGTGALCESILPSFKGSYNLIEVSNALHSVQRAKFGKHKNVKCHLGYEKVQRDDGECTVVACEVLDNLPHDLIRIEPDGSLSQAVVVTNDSASYRDVPGRYYLEFQPITDPLIIKYLNVIKSDTKVDKWERLVQGAHNIFPEYVYPRNCRFIPTSAFELLSRLSILFPSAQLAFFDFDALPDQIPLGRTTAPVVQTLYKGETINCSKLLVKPGDFDIFFPTDFALLSRMIQHFWPSHKTNVQKQTTFLQKHADLQKTTVKNGFNPLLHTFKNVSVLIATPNPR